MLQVLQKSGLALFKLLRLKLGMSYDPAITLLGVYLAGICAHKQETRTRMFTAALLIASNQKQFKCHKKQNE